jgi:hypothetical protein
MPLSTIEQLVDERWYSMSFVYVFFNKKIRWNIYKDDPSILELCSRPGWFLINPLSSKFVHGGFSSVKFEAVVGDRALAETRAMIFFSPVSDNFDRDEFREYVNLFVRNIRHFSKQPELGGIYIDKIYIANNIFGDDFDR